MVGILYVKVSTSYQKKLLHQDIKYLSKDNENQLT